MLKTCYIEVTNYQKFADITENIYLCYNFQRNILNVMRFFVSFIILLLFVLPQNLLASNIEEDNGVYFKRYYFIGIANDTFEDMNNLKSSNYLEDILSALKKNIKLTSLPNIYKDKNNTEILTAFDEFYKMVNGDNEKGSKMAIIYISSHGGLENGNYYLQCNDKTKIEADTLIDKVNKLVSVKSVVVLFILDTCNSGAILEGWKVPDEYGNNLLVVTSCGAEDISSESSGRSFLSDGICKAFNNHGAFKDSYLSFESLTNYINGNYPKEESQTQPMIKAPSSKGIFPYQTVICRYDWKKDFIPWTASSMLKGLDKACWAGMGLSAITLGVALGVEGAQIVKIKNNREKGLDTLAMRNSGKTAAIVSSISAGVFLASYLTHSLALISESNSDKKTDKIVRSSPYGDAFGVGMSLAFKF